MVSVPTRGVVQTILIGVQGCGSQRFRVDLVRNIVSLAENMANG
jgi:hypothetical protein